MSGALSPTHSLIIIGVLVLLFGAKKLPDTARGIGQSLRIFKTELSAAPGDEPTEHPAAGDPTPQSPTAAASPTTAAQAPTRAQQPPNGQPAVRTAGSEPGAAPHQAPPVATSAPVVGHEDRPAAGG